MRNFVMAAMLAALGVFAADAAWAAENWCARNLGDSADKPCVSAPLDYCLRGIGIGGVCGRDRSYLQDTPTARERTQKPARRAGARDRWD